jgi:hypothetical protein
MAGAGYKLFNTGDVLTAAQVNTYLNEQTVMVFADSAARTTALSGVLAEGMVSYLQDTAAVEVYNGSAWVAVGGGGLTSPLTTKGDIWVYGTGDTRLPVGTNGHTLVADSVEATGLKWAAPSSGGMTQLATGSMSGTTTTITSISGSYKNLELIIRDPANSTSDGTPAVRINGDTSGVYGSVTFVQAGADVAATATSFGMGYHENVTDGIIKIVFTDYANTSTFKMIESRNFSKNTSTNIYAQANWGLARITSAITEINLIWTAGQTWNAGTYILYGVS